MNLQLLGLRNKLIERRNRTLQEMVRTMLNPHNHVYIFANPVLIRKIERKTFMNFGMGRSIVQRLECFMLNTEGSYINLTQNLMKKFPLVTPL